MSSRSFSSVACVALSRLEYERLGPVAGGGWQGAALLPPGAMPLGAGLGASGWGWGWGRAVQSSREV